jgi:HEAT repeat protein
MHRRSLAAFALVGVCSVMVACQTTPTRKSSRNKSKPADSAVVAERATDGGAYRDPVARATLREKALTFLGSAAASGPPEERGNAIESLQTSPARLYPILDTALTDPTIGVRSVAAMTVGRAKLDAAAPKVRPLLNDSAPQARASAMFALRMCGEPVDLTPMAGLLNDPDLRVRSQTAFLLGELGEPSALGLLRDSARSSVAKAAPSEVRLWDLQLAEARVKLGDEGSLQEIRAALFPAKPEDLEATALACQILGQVKDQLSINRLIVLTAVQDDSKQFMPAEIRLGAAAALARMGQRQGSYIADQYRANPKDALRAQSAYVYGETRQIENLPTLAEMMNDPIGRVRVSAAAAIVKITEAGGSAGSAVSGVP